MINFIRMFLSYGLVLVICTAIVVAAVLIGIKLRKIKNSKEIAENAESGETEN